MGMRILVVGVHGQLACSLQERGSAHGIDIVALGRPEIDLTDPRDLRLAFERVGPRAVVNAAAYTAVDQAESEPAIAEAVNALGPALVARAAFALDIPVVHVSTDYVFDGSLTRPYREDDPVAPLGVYGRSKLAGERALAEVTPNHAILRTAWVYSPFGRNFVRTMLRLAETREEVGVVADQVGSPTSALDLADGVLTTCQNLVDRPDDPSLRGVFHMAGSGFATWADFATEIFAISARLGGPSARVRRITTADYPTPAKRPANSRLDGTKLAENHGIRLPDWRPALDACLRRLIAT